MFDKGVSQLIIRIINQHDQPRFSCDKQVSQD